MMEILEFIKEYYYLIILILALVILIIEFILSFRIKPNQNILSFIDKLIPQLVIDAESKYGSGHGEDKMLFCIRSIAASLASVFNIQNINTYESYIRKAVELVLSTPKKKEGV